MTGERLDLEMPGWQMPSEYPGPAGEPVHIADLATVSMLPARLWPELAALREAWAASHEAKVAQHSAEILLLKRLLAQTIQPRYTSALQRVSLLVRVLRDEGSHLSLQRIEAGRQQLAEAHADLQAASDERETIAARVADLRALVSQHEAAARLLRARHDESSSHLPHG